MTLLSRIQSLIEGGVELLKAEADQATHRFEDAILKAMVKSGMLAGGALLGLLGLGVALAGLTVYLSGMWGTPMALGVVGGIVLLIGSGLYITARVLINKPASEDPLQSMANVQQTLPPEERVAHAKLKMRDAVTKENLHSRSEIAPSQEYGMKDEAMTLKDEAIRFAKENPVLTGAAALFVISFFGPGKLLRFASRGAAAAGLAAKAYESIQGAQNNGAQRHPTSPSVGQPREAHYDEGPVERTYGRHYESVSRHSHT